MLQYLITSDLIHSYLIAKKTQQKNKTGDQLILTAYKAELKHWHMKHLHFVLMLLLQCWMVL